MTSNATKGGPATTWRSHIGIPVRNLWMLLVYASELASFQEAINTDMDGDAEIAEVLARLLVVVVERRLRRSLSRGYEDRRMPLSRLRGRIDWLGTETAMLLRRGRVMCRYEDLTHDTPRNRLVRAALQAASSRVRNAQVITDSRRLARLLAQAGVSECLPSRTEMSRDQLARNDGDDRLMVAAARLFLEVTLPSEATGDSATTRLQRDEVLLRRIFEKAVAGLYRHELHGRDGWNVSPQKSLHWQAECATAGMVGRLPVMAADIVLQQGHRRIVVDTKFTNALKPRQHGGFGFDSAHIYQLYAYLRSQGGAGDPAADSAEGILLYPAVEDVFDAAVTIQGHRLSFVTVDLSAPAAVLRESLLDVVRKR